MKNQRILITGLDGSQTVTDKIYETINDFKKDCVIKHIDVFQEFEMLKKNKVIPVNQYNSIIIDKIFAVEEKNPKTNIKKLVIVDGYDVLQFEEYQDRFRTKLKELDDTVFIFICNGLFPNVNVDLHLSVCPEFVILNVESYHLNRIEEELRNLLSIGYKHKKTFVVSKPKNVLVVKNTKHKESVSDLIHKKVTGLSLKNFDMLYIDLVTEKDINGNLSQMITKIENHLNSKFKRNKLIVISNFEKLSHYKKHQDKLKILIEFFEDDRFLFVLNNDMFKNFRDNFVEIDAQKDINLVHGITEIILGNAIVVDTKEKEKELPKLEFGNIEGTGARLIFQSSVECKVSLEQIFCDRISRHRYSIFYRDLSSIKNKSDLNAFEKGMHLFCNSKTEKNKIVCLKGVEKTDFQHNLISEIDKHKNVSFVLVCENAFDLVEDFNSFCISVVERNVMKEIENYYFIFHYRRSDFNEMECEIVDYIIPEFQKWNNVEYSTAQSVIDGAMEEGSEFLENISKTKPEITGARIMIKNPESNVFNYLHDYFHSNTSIYNPFLVNFGKNNTQINNDEIISVLLKNLYSIGTKNKHQLIIIAWFECLEDYQKNYVFDMLRDFPDVSFIFESELEDYVYPQLKDVTYKNNAIYLNQREVELIDFIENHTDFAQKDVEGARLVFDSNEMNDEIYSTFQKYFTENEKEFSGWYINKDHFGQQIDLDQKQKIEKLFASIVMNENHSDEKQIILLKNYENIVDVDFIVKLMTKHPKINFIFFNKSTDKTLACLKNVPVEIDVDSNKFKKINFGGKCLIYNEIEHNLLNILFDKINPRFAKENYQIEPLSDEEESKRSIRLLINHIDNDRDYVNKFQEFIFQQNLFTHVEFDCENFSAVKVNNFLYSETNIPKIIVFKNFKRNTTKKLVSYYEYIIQNYKHIGFILLSNEFISNKQCGVNFSTLDCKTTSMKMFGGTLNYKFEIKRKHVDNVVIPEMHKKIESNMKQEMKHSGEMNKLENAFGSKENRNTLRLVSVVDETFNKDEDSNKNDSENEKLITSFLYEMFVERLKNKNNKNFNNPKMILKEGTGKSDAVLKLSELFEKGRVLFRIPSENEMNEFINLIKETNENNIDKVLEKLKIPHSFTKNDGTKIAIGTLTNYGEIVSIEFAFSRLMFKVKKDNHFRYVPVTELENFERILNKVPLFVEDADGLTMHIGSYTNEGIIKSIENDEFGRLVVVLESRTHEFHPDVLYKTHRIEHCSKLKGVKIISKDNVKMYIGDKCFALDTNLLSPPYEHIIDKFTMTNQGERLYFENGLTANHYFLMNKNSFSFMELKSMFQGNNEVMDVIIDKMNKKLGH